MKFSPSYTVFYRSLLICRFLQTCPNRCRHFFRRQCQQHHVLVLDWHSNNYKAGPLPTLLQDEVSATLLIAIPYTSFGDFYGDTRPKYPPFDTTSVLMRALRILSGRVAESRGPVLAPLRSAAEMPSATLPDSKVTN